MENLKASPLEFWKTLVPKTIQEAINLDSPQLSVIKKECGEVVTNAFLTLAVTDLVESFNIGKTMNQMQIVFVVETIRDDYYFLRPDELKYVFNKAKKGHYGVMYDRIDCAVICDWIEKYIEERMEAIMTKNIETQKTESKTSLVDWDDKVLEGIKNIGNLKEKAIEIEIKPVRQLTQNEIIVQDILKEFDVLHKNKDYDAKESIRMIEYLGQNLTQDKFLKVRLEEMNKI